MSQGLKGGLPRVFRRHDGARGRWYRGHYLALEERFGPFDGMTRQYAASVCERWCEYRSDVLALEAAEQQRATSRGRRPDKSEIRALKKRKGLSEVSYDAALRRLEELAAQQPKGSSFAARVRAAGARVRAAGGQP